MGIPGTRLFITGGSGFVGRQVLHRLAAASPREVTYLYRARHPQEMGSLPEHWQGVHGDLGDPASYRMHLTAGSTVVHVAALTGKARPDRFKAVNVDGTRQLLEVAAQAGATRFVFVSSIAAKFPDTDHYPYAQSKIEAEGLLRAGPLPWAIIRPTLVFGGDSPVLKGLITLVKGPVGVLFGRGQSKVQPVAVGDVASLIERVASVPTWDGSVIEVGGPNVLSFKELLRHIRARLRGHAGLLLRLPLSPLRATLAGLEPLLLPWLPLTAGQLAAFANDSTADPHPATAALRTQWMTIGAMLDDFVIPRN